MYYTVENEYKKVHGYNKHIIWNKRKILAKINRKQNIKKREKKK